MRSLPVYIHRRGEKAFTLVEMLVVVLLIAIVATVGISLLGGTSKGAAGRVNVSNMRQLTGLISAYQHVHEGVLPNKLDSLIDVTKITGANYRKITTADGMHEDVEVVDDPATVLYCGKDTDKDGVIDNPDYTAKGLMPESYSGLFRTLTVTKLTTNDVNQLAKLGITKVMDMNPRDDGNLFHGMETYAERILQPGDPVATLDPSTIKNGRGIYRDMGFHEISNIDEYPFQGRDTDLATELREKAMSTMRYLVFGIGPDATIVGERNAGLQEAMTSPITTKGHYNRYMIVVKMGGRTVADMTSDFAGVLDPQGNNSRSAGSWATRTGK